MTQARRAALMGLVVMLATVSGYAAQGKGKSKGTTPKAQVWQVDFLVDGEHYTGTMTLTNSKGSVTGKMMIDAPTRIEGDVTGKQAAETLSLDYPYTMVAENCTGRVQVEAKLAPKAQEGSGTVHATDCHGQASDGTVSFKKAAPNPGSQGQR
ncbi:MAG: hypothetical protein ACM36C_17040 [Acidobacteriota bacterium]